MKHIAARPPFNAMPVALFGEAACKFADEIGVHVQMNSLKGGRDTDTIVARSFLAKGASTGHDFSSCVWLIVAYTFDARVYRDGAAAL